jgi:2-keto-4-pentenoate hydratase
MDPQRAQEAAEHLWSAWRERRLIAALPEPCRPRNLEEGYAVQAAMESLCDGGRLGWKIAATSRDGQRHIGVSEPLAGRLFERFAHPDGAVLPAGHLHMKVAEAEFAFRFARDLPPRGSDYGVAEVLDAVDRLHLAIEVPDSRYVDFAAIGAPQLVADDSCACYFVLGPAAPANWRELDLSRHPVSVLRNDAPAGDGSGANVLGDPRLALAWLVNDCARRGVDLRAGEVVTTGTCVKPVPIAPGDRILADFGSLGAVRVSFTD